ncbi:MAG: ferrous iron transport protein A [Acidobacteria bacterium]|nr:ferrous iron transport protein A [Acidobacteriota bacterium]
MTLDSLVPGQSARITYLEPSHPSLIRLSEMGFISGQHIQLIRKAPLGEPFKVRVMNYELCIRKSEAAAIHVEPVSLTA